MTKIKKTDAFNDPTIKVPFVLPEITNEDKNSVVKALSATLLTDGPQLRKFESAFKSKKRTLCAPPAPPHGLFLEKVIY